MAWGMFKRRRRNSVDSTLVTTSGPNAVDLDALLAAASSGIPDQRPGEPFAISGAPSSGSRSSRLEAVSVVSAGYRAADRRVVDEIDNCYDDYEDDSGKPPSYSLVELTVVELCDDGRLGVVGESYYQEALNIVAQGKVFGPDFGDHGPVRALLVPEPENPYDKTLSALMS